MLFLYRYCWPRDSLSGLGWLVYYIKNTRLEIDSEIWVCILLHWMYAFITGHFRIEMLLLHYEILYRFHGLCKSTKHNFQGFVFSVSLWIYHGQRKYIWIFSAYWDSPSGKSSGKYLCLVNKRILRSQTQSIDLKALKTLD